MQPRMSEIKAFDLVVFGGTGDLARRKILPALFKRFCAGQMPAPSRLIGAARSKMTTSEYRGFVRSALREFCDAADGQPVDQFLEQIDYVVLDAKEDQGWQSLAEMMGTETIRAFYFSVGPSLFKDLAERLHKWKLVGPESRIVVEKPFGRDLETARALNRILCSHFDENQIYRIDHYLRK